MTCCEFERKFNELLDGEGEAAARARAAAPTTRSRPVATDLEHALIDHASRCPACHEVAARYQILRRALHAWNSPPVAPADLVDRILLADANADAPAASAWAVVGKRKRERLWPIVLTTWGVSVAAACMFGLVNSLLERERHNRPMPPTRLVGPADELHSVRGQSGVRPADSRVLNDALAEATRATWDLAFSASEPAARISRQMLDAATAPERVPGDSAILGRAATVSVTMPALNSLAPDPSAAKAMLQEVGDRLASGVGPFSRTARHAFGFLLGPAPAKLEGRNTRPAAKGA